MPMAGPNATPAVSTPGNNNNAGAGAAVANNAVPGSNKTWELSDYELHRTPQDAIQDGSEIAVSPRALHSELMCPICLDMLDSTMTTKECLHRFCAECIITALRSGNKECPTCRKKLVSKRSLRPDPNFDMLISKIYPSRDEYEAQQQKAMARLSKSHNQLALASSIEEGMKAQSQIRKAKPAGKGTAVANSGNETGDGTGTVVTDAPPSNSGGPNANGGTTTATPSIVGIPNVGNGMPGASAASASNQSGAIPLPSPAKSRTESVGESSNTSGYSEEVTEVELVFKPHPDMVSASASGIATAQNQIRYIKTTANASVEHLAKYLGMRLALDAQSEASSPLHNCTIYVNATGGEFTTVQQNQTLSQVCEKYWRFNKPLEMYYSWKKI